MITKVKIDTATYDISIVSEIIILDGRQCKGSIDYNKNIIKIADFVGESQAKITLMHEIVHGMVFERGISLDKGDEETIVDELGKAMLQVIRDNKDLIEYLGN